MNGSEIMLDAVNGIAPDLVDEAAGYRFKRNGTNALAWAAAACLMLGVGAAMAAAMLNGAETPGNETAQGTPVPTPDISVMRIIEGTGAIGLINTDEEWEPGTCRLLGTLAEAIGDENNRGALFSVNVHFLKCASDELRKQAEKFGESLAQAYNDPDYKALLREFDAVAGRMHYFARKGEEVPQGYYEQNALVIFMNDEEYWLYSEKGTPGEMLIYLNHAEELGITLTEEQVNAYCKAAQRVMDAIEEYEGPHYFESTDRIKSSFEREAKKLIEKGLCIELSSMEIPQYGSGIGGIMCHAYLTAEQILDFPAEPDECYCIYFTSERGDGMMDTD